MSATKIFPSFDHYRDFHEWLAAPDAAVRTKVAAAIDLSGVDEFLAGTPSYRPTAYNGGMLHAWLKARGGLPMTHWNLQIAFRDLSEDGLLEKKRPQEKSNTFEGVPRASGSVIAAVQSTGAEREALERLKDDPSLSDHARKQRDRRLRLLAGEQRRSMSNLPGRPTREHPDGGDPAIRI